MTYRYVAKVLLRIIYYALSTSCSLYLLARNNVSMLSLRRSQRCEFGMLSIYANKV